VSFDEAVERTEELILESVRLRLCADVPLGVLLSGGIDSTLICWAMAKLNANIEAFTMAAPGDVQDEAGAARETAQILGIPHRVVPLPEQRLTLLDELTEAYSEPFAPFSALGVLLVSQAVRSSATVLLTGDGGDDVFLGYPFMSNAWLAQQTARRLPPGTPQLWRGVRSLVPAAGPLRRVKNFLEYATSGISAYARAHDGLPWFHQRSMLGERLGDAALRHRQMEPSFDSAQRLLTDVLDYHQRLHFTSEFMQKVDGGTMYHALEARSPLLDHQIWEFAASLPYETRFHGGQLKAVLREIVRRRVGESVASRKKQGFTVPVERWLAGKWSHELDRLKGSTLLESNGWIAPGRLEPAVAEALRNGRVPLQMWYMLAFERWLERSQATPAAQHTHAVTC
jgi:asparagine synthase (glutamine-hydrolysing)